MIVVACCADYLGIVHTHWCYCSLMLLCLQLVAGGGGGGYSPLSMGRRLTLEHQMVGKSHSVNNSTVSVEGFPSLSHTCFCR